MNRKKLREIDAQGTAALLFLVLAALIVMLVFAYWTFALKPELKTNADTNAQVLAESYGRGLASILDSVDGSRASIHDVTDFVHELMLLTDSSTGQPFIQGFSLDLDYDLIPAPKGSMDIKLGHLGCTDCPASDVLLYSPKTGAVTGVAHFYGNPSFLMTLQRETGRRLAIGTAVVLALLALSWLAVFRLMRRLKAGEERFRLIVETAPYPLVVVDAASGGVALCNRRVGEVFGLTEENLAGKTLRTLFPKNGDGMMAHVADRRRLNDHEMAFRRPDGSRGFALVSLDTTEVDGRTVGIIGINDITRRRSLEEELRDLNRGLKARVEKEVALSRAKDVLLIQQGRHAIMGEMLASITHQWKQPLSALSLVCDNLAEAPKYGELNEEFLAEATSDIRHLIGRMSQTIDDFRDFFRPAKDKSLFSLKATTEETLKLMAPTLGRDAISVSVQGDAMAWGYPNELSQVLMNLIANARDAIREKKPAQGLIAIGLAEEPGKAMLRVSDNGNGIPEAMLPRLFEAYATSKESGTGFGLYMSRMIVEGMGGHIQVDNIGEGEGAAFTLVLPTSGDAATGQEK